MRVVLDVSKPMFSNRPSAVFLAARSSELEPCFIDGSNSVKNKKYDHGVVLGTPLFS